MSPEEGTMRKIRFTEHQIIAVLKSVEAACAESFFHSLKVECIRGERFISREVMRTVVFNYIECDYNRWRRHSACGGLSPEQFENQQLA
jgi:hypothetical protein